MSAPGEMDENKGTSDDEQNQTGHDPDIISFLHRCWQWTQTMGTMAQWCTPSAPPTPSTPSTAPRARSAPAVPCWTAKAPHPTTTHAHTHTHTHTHTQTHKHIPPALPTLKNTLCPGMPSIKLLRDHLIPYLLIG